LSKLGVVRVLEYDWENSIGHWVCSTSHALRKALGTRLTREGITLRQWEVLAWLSCKGGGSQSEVAEGLGIEPHTLAGVLSRMERDGLLERKSCVKDRRRNTIQPTEKAEEMWARVTRLCQEVRSRAVEGFTTAELETFRNLCRRISENLAEPADEPANDQRDSGSVASTSLSAR
jgi:MarR family transcriptional regulator for hemolysin